MADNELKDLIVTGLAYQEKSLKKYKEYPPIFNSGIMLNKILKNIDKESYLVENKDSLNVGLLAAKALDFESEIPEFQEYSDLLHIVWSNLLQLIVQQYPPAGIDQVKWGIAYDYYKDKYKLPGGKPNDTKIYHHMEGIDFKDEVKKMPLKKGAIICQWRAPAIHQGDYYTKSFMQSRPDCLGINEYQEDYKGYISKRVIHYHKLSGNHQLTVLQSTARGIVDTWSVKGSSQPTTGGCIQYFTTEKNRL